MIAIPRSSTRFGAVSIGRLASTIAAPSFERHGPGHGQITAAWPDLVGPELAGMSRPLRLTWPKGAAAGSTRRQKQGAVLTIGVEGPRAIEFQHAAPRIMEAINSLFGYRAVAKLRLVQASPDRTRQRQRRRPVEATNAEEITGVDSTDLRNALARLGNITNNR